MLKASGTKRVLDVGCGSGKLIQGLLKESQFAEVVGVDISHRALEAAERRLRLDRVAPRQRERVRLFQTALTSRDKRLAGFNAAAVVEVIEHSTGRACGRSSACCSSRPGRVRLR